MTKTVKVAVIGAGMMGKNHLKTYKNLQGVERKLLKPLPKPMVLKLFLQWKKLPLM